MSCSQPAPLASPYRRLVLACFPKSGSTFLASILAGLPGFQKISLVPAYGRREQELSLECLVAAHQTCGHFVAQHHLRYSQETQRLINLFSLQPLVLVRNIGDVVASIRDHLRGGSIVIAQAYIPPDLPKWEDERIERFAADVVVPWYFNFYASWAECSTRLELTYESLVTGAASVVRRIRDRTGLDATDDQIQAAVEKTQTCHASTRFNVGVCGRGKNLGAETLSRIRALASYYRFLDLSPLGL